LSVEGVDLVLLQELTQEFEALVLPRVAFPAPRDTISQPTMSLLAHDDSSSHPQRSVYFFLFSFLLLSSLELSDSSLELSDTKIYEPEIRALLGTASHQSTDPRRSLFSRTTITLLTHKTKKAEHPRARAVVPHAPRTHHTPEPQVVKGQTILANALAVSVARF